MSERLTRAVTYLSFPFALLTFAVIFALEVLGLKVRGKQHDN